MCSFYALRYASSAILLPDLVRYTDLVDLRIRYEETTVSI